MKDLKAERLIESIKKNYSSIEVKQCKDVRFGYYAQLITQDGVRLNGTGLTQYKALLNAIQSGFSSIASDSFLFNVLFEAKPVIKAEDILPIYSN